METIKTLAKPVALLLAFVLPIILLCFQNYGSYLWTFPLIAIWCCVYRKPSLEELGFKRSGFAMDLLLGVSTGIVLGVTCGLMIQAMGLTAISIDDFSINQVSFGSSTGYRLAANSTNATGFVIYFAYYIVLVGLGEEIIWRAIIQQEIKLRSNRHIAVFATGICFGLVHLFLLIAVPILPGLVFLALIATGGIIWGYLFEKFHSIWMLAISHGLTSAIIWKFFFFATHT